VQATFRGPYHALSALAILQDMIIEESPDSEVLMNYTWMKALMDSVLEVGSGQVLKALKDGTYQEELKPRILARMSTLLGGYIGAMNAAKRTKTEQEVSVMEMVIEAMAKEKKKGTES
jgi:hypothetical protein